MLAPRSSEHRAVAIGRTHRSETLGGPPVFMRSRLPVQFFFDSHRCRPGLSQRRERCAESIPPLSVDHRQPSEVGQNSWRRPLAGVGARDSRSCCPETRGRRRAPEEPGSFPPQLADSTCPVRHLSGERDRIRDGDRHRVASSIPCSYCFRSRLVACRALMIRIRSSRGTCATNRICCCVERPIVISRSSTVE